MPGRNVGKETARDLPRLASCYETNIGLIVTDRISRPGLVARRRMEGAIMIPGKSGSVRTALVVFLATVGACALEPFGPEPPDIGDDQMHS